jgi:DNA polymerase III sliding clamp (beta) subunit (PCNA family)
MKASELKGIVGLLAPCLGESDVLPALSYLCFDKEGVYAYNDLVATRYDFDHGLGSFGVQGKGLSSLLAGWGERELELDTVKDGGALRLAIKSGKSLTKLPALPTSSFIMEQPKVEGGASGTITGAIALGELLDCVATSAANPAYKGVTLRVKEGESLLRAGATAGTYMGVAVVGSLGFGKAKQDRAWVVPKLAVQQMLALQKHFPSDKLKLQLGDRILLARRGSGTVISKLITEAPAPNFEKPLEGEVKAIIGGWKKNEELAEALTTASSIFNADEGSVCSFSLDDGVLSIKARNRQGAEHKDKVKVDANKKRTFDFHCDPNLLANAYHYSALPEDSGMVLQEGAALFGNADQFLYAAAFMRVKEAAETTEE